MLPLAAEKFPATPDELAAALTGGFAARGISGAGVHVEGAAPGALTALRVELTGASFTRGFRVSGTPAAEAAPVVAERLEIVGAPLDFEGTPMEVRVEAEGAALRFGGQPSDGALVLADADGGSVSLAVGHADLEALLHRLATTAAEKQGVEIKKTKLELTARGPRALSFRCEVTAKMFVMSADLSLSGNLDVDEQLNARFSGLTLGGDAMIAKLAAGFVRPQLDKLEGRVFPLLALAPGGLKLHDVEIAVRDGLEVRAKFGRL